jgi:hypothetical protein
MRTTKLAEQGSFRFDGWVFSASLSRRLRQVKWLVEVQVD